MSQYKTEAIFQTTAPYDNPYQNQDAYKRLLFVCSAGLLRSATAANLYSGRGYNTRACGTHQFALIPLSANLIEWADLIIFVNRQNYEVALNTFNDTTVGTDKLRNQSRVLDIPDVFSFMEKGLVDSFDEQLGSNI